jgi:hypothetical protein
MAYFATEKTLSDALTDTSVPSFLFVCTPPGRVALPMVTGT